MWGNITIFYLIPNIAQIFSSFWTLVAEKKELFAEIKLSGEKETKAHTTYLRKEHVFPKGKFCTLFSEGGYLRGSRVYSVSYKVNNETAMSPYSLLL